jgi:hypothetical protein
LICPSNRALDYIQFEHQSPSAASRQARKIAALAEAWQVPVVPRTAGQMQNNFHVRDGASINAPMAEVVSARGCRGGNELFW